MPWVEACPGAFRGWLCHSFFFFCCVQFDVQLSYQSLQLFPKQTPSAKFKICWLIQFGSDAAGTTRKQTEKLKNKLLERVQISLGRPKIFNLSELGTTYKAQVIVMTIFGYGVNLMFCFVVAAVVVVFYFLEKIKQFWNDYLLSYNYQHKHLAERMVITCLTQLFTHSSTLISAIYFFSEPRTGLCITKNRSKFGNRNSKLFHPIM